MADDTFEYITTDFMVSIDSGTPSVQPVEYIIELGEQGIPGVQGEQGEPGYSPVVNYTWDNNTIQFTLVNRDYTETTPNLYDYVLKRDGSNASNPITFNHLTMGYEYGSPYINSDNNLYIRGEIISLQANSRVTYNNKEIATVNDIGNGTITLTQGGVTKGTFTTNQSGNTTIELDAGGGSISNPLNIGYTDQGVARTLNLGIDTSSNKIVSSYMELTGGSYYRAPLYFLENVASPLVGTVNSLGAIDLSINTMVGTDGTTDGVTGTVPAPLTTDAGKYLRADGTWATPSGGGGGTSDYTELTNKPQINSVILTGNKTSSDLGLQNELTQGTGISIVNDTISIDNTVALKTDIPSLAGYATENWVTNQGYLTSISSSDVITALGYTPYSASNPNGYTNNVGTVTSVNNTQPDTNGNVSINIPDVTNYVTTNTTQTITGSKTFTQQLRVNSSNGILNYGGYQGLVRRDPNVSSVYTEPLLIVDNSDKNVTVGTQYTTLNLKGSSTRPTYNSNELALLSDIGSGGGAVDSVNGQTGNVVLTASDVGALPDTTVIPTNADYVDLTTAQTIGGSKTFTSSIIAWDGLNIVPNMVGSSYINRKLGNDYYRMLTCDNSSVTLGNNTQRSIISGSTTRPYYNSTSTELALLSDIPTVPTTDQTYNSTSTNPQSGTAVAEAIASVNIPIATSSTVGTVKPDNTTTKVDANGTLSAISRNVGEIVQSTLPLTDAGLHLLDGTLINGSGIYAEFVDYIAELYADNPTANCFCTETEWQNSVTTYGSCGKFVYDSVNNTVRLPKVTGKLDGTTDLTALGDLEPLFVKLPNIIGQVGQTGYDIAPDGAFYSTGMQGVYSSGSFGFYRTYFDASRSSSVYSGDGTDTTIHEQAINVLYYIVIANSTKTEIQSDIDEIATDLNGKADTDLTNVTNAGNIKIANASMPSSRRIQLTTGASGAAYIAPADGYLYATCDTAQYGWIIVANDSFSSYETSTMGAAGGVCEWVPIRKGSTGHVYYYNASNVAVWFIYAVGSESEAQ